MPPTPPAGPSTPGPGTPDPRGAGPRASRPATSPPGALGSGPAAPGGSTPQASASDPAVPSTHGPGGPAPAPASPVAPGPSAAPSAGPADSGTPAPSAPIRILLVDDQALLRAGFRMVLASQADLEVVGEAGDGLEAIEVLERVEADVVLMDVRMPRLDGVEATRRIHERPAAPRVLILTTFDLDEYAFSALRAGASGFMLKDVPPSELVAAIRAVHSGDAVVAPSTTRRLLDRFAPMLPGAASVAHPELDRLTGREQEVMRLVAQGLSNGEIAARLVLSEATVKTHVGRVLTKLGLRDRVQVVVLAYETGIVRVGGGPAA